MFDLARAPKAEFHLHFEATLSWERFARLTGRSGPRAPWLESGFGSFDDFRKPFMDYVLPALRVPGMYEQLAGASAAWLAEVGVRYAELSVAALLPERLSLSAEATARALCRAFAEAERASGVTLRIFSAFRRDSDPIENVRWLERWLGWSDGRLSGIDLQGYERECPTAAQKPVYDLARSAGLALRAHAGEHGTWEDVRDAVDVLGATSINHGVRAVDDAGLLRELVARGTVLHVCPTSNVMLGVAPSYREHPLRRLLDAGVRVTLNSDDPLVFDTDVTRELDLARREMGLSDDDVRGLLRTAWEAALVPEEERRARLAQV